MFLSTLKNQFELSLYVRVCVCVTTFLGGGEATADWGGNNQQEPCYVEPCHQTCK